MKFYRFVFLMVTLAFCLLVAACEDTNIQLAAEAGMDAVKAITLSSKAVASLSEQSARYSDGQNEVASAGNSYAKRLLGLVGEHLLEDGVEFNFKVYLDPTINAFAMGDGTIRIYSGLMDILSDDELLFVIGHEMGHVVKQHIRKKMRLAYAGSAIRMKGRLQFLL